jgi:hypothetical protein
MTATTPQSIIQTLATLKSHYEQQLAQAETQASQHYADLLSHTDALLVGLLVQSNGHAAPTTTLEPAAIAPAPKAVAQPKPKAKASTTKAKPEAAPAPRISFELLPAYQGKSKLDAIATVLEENQGKVVHQDDIIQELYGELSPEALKVERLRMKAALRQGVKKKLWQKSPKPSSYILKVAKATATAQPKPSDTGIKPTTSTAKTKTPSSGKSFPMLPEYQGMTKIDAIAKVLTQQSDRVVHQDTIIQLLYGDLSPEELHLESRRMRASLFQGVSKGLWQRAPKQPSSYILKSAKESIPAAKVSPRTQESKLKAPAKGTRAKGSRA